MSKFPLLNSIIGKQLAKKSLYKDFPELKIHKCQNVEDKIHLESAMQWLCLAQNVTGVGGVSALYNLNKKEWGNPYRETTGYIIPTFLSYYKITGDKNFEKRALEMGSWEIEEQLPDGSYGEVSSENLTKNPPLNKKVFNTGQVILGLCSLYDYTKEKKYITTAIKSAEWLLSIQEKDGRWEKYTTQGAKTYHSRVAWSLLEVFKRTGIDRYKKSAEKNLKWVIKQQNQNGWFNNCSLSEENKPWTHLIAYTISGLLESSIINRSKKCFDSAYSAAEKLLEKYNIHKPFAFNFLSGSFDDKWESRDKYSCLTGDAQIAIIWLKLYGLTKEERFKIAADRIIDQINKTQILDGVHEEVNGGIFGSFPPEGDYCGFAILNWATKFFADAVMLKSDLNRNLLG